MKLTITSDQSRNYGEVTQRYSITAEFDVANEADRKAKYRLLDIVIEQQFAIFERDLLPQPRETENEHITTGGVLVAIKEGNEVRYRAKVGKWGKWGVPVYPEALDERMKDAVERYGEFNLEFYSCAILIEDGKPKKVTRIWLISQ